MTLLLALLFQSAEELYRKCDTEIPWITDGTELLDAEQLGRRPRNYRVDRPALLEQAKKQALDRKRLVLWYCPRIPGSHMNRAQVLDNYMKVVVFTDPGVIDLVRTKFVPLRACCDSALSTTLGIRRFEFMEPGLVFLSPEGKVVHKIDRIRTFNADWIRAALIAVLRANPKYNEPAEDLLAGGDDERALSKASAEQKALIHRRMGKFDAVDVPIQQGIALLNQGRFGAARRILEEIDSAESLYYLGLADSRTGEDPMPRWKELVERHPDTRWAWRAAANLVRGHDTLPDGPMAHHFEDVTWVPVTSAPASTCLPGGDVQGTARRAVGFLLQTQRSNGSWDDSRYVYCDGPEIHPNVVMAVTALAASALTEWRELDRGGIGPALDRADGFLRDEEQMARGENEDCYADAYRLLYFARSKQVSILNGIVEELAKRQDRNGYWAHEYPNPFATAAVVHALHAAKQAGADVSDAMVRRAADAIAKTRGRDREQAYMAGRRPSSGKDSMARTPMCELALLESSQGTVDDVAEALELYWKHREKLDAVRVSDFHADNELGGFFYFHGVFHSAESVFALEADQQKKHLARFREQILSLPEIDGSFIDSHELGKSYGTAMALLVLSRTR